MTDQMADDTSGRVAFRLAYEEVIRWRGELDMDLDRIRNRAMGFLAVAAIAAGSGLSSFPLKSASPRPSILWIPFAVWMVFVGLGVAANLGAVIATSWALDQGPFGDYPSDIAALPANSKNFPTSDSVYRELAEWGEFNCLNLYLEIHARRRWLRGSIAGITLELTGLAALHGSRLFS